MEDLRQRISTRQQADSDERLIELWLHGRSQHTQRAYRRDVGKFLSFTGKRVGEAALGDLQDFADSLEELAPASRVRVLSAVKSLMTFGHQVGYGSETSMGCVCAHADGGGDDTSRNSVPEVESHVPTFRNRECERIGFLDQHCNHSCLG